MLPVTRSPPPTREQRAVPRNLADGGRRGAVVLRPTRGGRRRPLRGCAWRLPSRGPALDLLQQRKLGSTARGRAADPPPAGSPGESCPYLTRLDRPAPRRRAPRPALVAGCRPVSRRPDHERGPRSSLRGPLVPAVGPLPAGSAAPGRHCAQVTWVRTLFPPPKPRTKIAPCADSWTFVPQFSCARMSAFRKPLGIVFEPEPDSTWPP
jgi:hypothetical protein